jgi:hypothetical protein
MLSPVDAVAPDHPRTRSGTGGPGATSAGLIALFGVVTLWMDFTAT